MPSFCAYILFFFFSSRVWTVLSLRNTESRLHTHTEREWVSEEKAKWRRRIQSIQRRLQIEGKFKSAAISQWTHSCVSNLERRFFLAFFTLFKRYYIRFCACFLLFNTILNFRSGARKIKYSKLLCLTIEIENLLRQCKFLFWNVF